MDAVMNLIMALFPLAVLIAMGYLLKRTKFVQDEFWGNSEKLNYFILFPILLFSNLADVQLDLQGEAGKSIGNSARQNVATPAAMASVNGAMYGGAVLATATAQVAACAIVTAILTPLVTSWCYKHFEGQQSNGKATTDKASAAA